MQVQSPLHQHTSSPDTRHHYEPNPTHHSGTHSHPQLQSSPTVNVQRDGASMHPYQQQHYGGGQGPPQQRQYSANPLPPLYPDMNTLAQSGPSMPDPRHPQPPSIFPGGHIAPLPPPGQRHRVQPQERPLSFIGNNGKYKYELVVEQQPQRARMCGFGDKDRRPITPPPCVRLLVTDLYTGQPVTHEPSEANNFFYLQVDLYNDTGTHPVHVVQSSSSSPSVSISTATTTSFPPTPQRPNIPDFSQPVGYTAMGEPVYQPPSFPPPMGRVYVNPSTYQPQTGPGNPYGMPGGVVQGNVNERAELSTRNLIGSCVVSAAMLKDPEGKYGYWFVLQDLSVRTEGWFRLKLQFVNLCDASGTGVSKGTAPILAYVFTDKFQVYSAKKFPGVIESTPLSKCFASQGIKIPIRKDFKPDQERAAADEDEED